jgi:hypothetical protein
MAKHHAIKLYRAMEAMLHTFLNSALNGGERSALYFSHFNPTRMLTLLNGWEVV